MSILTRILFAIAIIAPLPALGAAERVALVIGMGNYEHVEALDNPVRDATAVAETLEGIGFKVTEVVDAPLQSLLKTLEDFAFRSETAELALIYFAGHGVQVQGENFLLPVDVQPRSNDDLRRQAISLDSLLAVVDRARKMRIVILDACRNNPFGGGISLASSAEQVDAAGGRGLVMAGGGLAASAPDRGTLVSYAAKDGSVALDGAGTNSPFARALIETLPQPGLEISLMFRQVRDKVLEQTGNRQEPYSYGSLSGVPFYLAGPDEGQQALPVDDLVAAWSSLPKEREPELVALAETGDTRSMVALAARRLDRGGDFRPADAVSWYSRAAEAGDPQAQFELARIYEEGVLVLPDPARAKALYMASADQEYADALNDVGFFYFHGMLGFDPDVSKALEYFERAANQRHPKAQHNFAVLIDRGQVPGKGPEDAANYLYAALRAGVTEVLVTLQQKPELFQRETRAALQRRLQEREFYSGAIDGSFGPGTNRGLRRAYGLEE
ncbi:caspase family protein [Aliiruegeria sabulilitoris]|uniref:caspase family protein n=1 Tax=Aliiruegeria sabulilitoris TaxID=1510458 RepID=UPI000829C8BF|nr:caspase family protein [Aliiruegeria sabulilitoris]NDR59029.1 peptidase C14, caspase catalytic subunit p20 [Pseudoruegeria sp. M32A2M]